MMRNLIILLTIVLFVALHCVYAQSQTTPEKCLASAGYSWCEFENRCVRPWELAKEKGLENTRVNIESYCNLKSNSTKAEKPQEGPDSHGCLASAGYSWCERENQCVRPWELAKQKNLVLTNSEDFDLYCSQTEQPMTEVQVSPKKSQPANSRVGGASDGHGCVAGAGYTWCAKENKCVRPWELAREKNIAVSPKAFQTYCESTTTIGSADANGCVAGAGYTWCAKENKCVRPWELAKLQNIENSPEAFTAYCSSTVSLVGGASDGHGCIAGAGYTWCAKENKCVRPWELAKLQNIENSPEAFTAYCSSTVSLVGGASDSHGCIAGAGYTWCAKENKCVRPWELAREKNIEVSPKAFAEYCN